MRATYSATFIPMLPQNATVAAISMIDDKAQHEVIGTYFSNVAT